MKVLRDKLNELEKVAHASEAAAGEARWAQAQEIVRRNDAGESLPAIARSWIKLRDGKSYGKVHAQRFARAWRRFGEATDRPSWFEAYAAACYSADVPPVEAVARIRAVSRKTDEKRQATHRASAKPTTLLLWASRSIEKQVQSGRVEALWELEEALAALMEAVERARALVFEGVAA